MSDVIEAMARAICRNMDGSDAQWRLYYDDLIPALHAAEKAGWRLVPVEPTKEMLHAARHIDFDGSEFTLPGVIEAAPRPWAEVER